MSGPEIYNQLAISEMEAGDYESAMSHYEEALSLADNETALVIRQNIAVLYEKEGDFAKALEQLRSARQPVRTHRRCRRKSVFWKAGKYWR